MHIGLIVFAISGLLAIACFTPALAARLHLPQTVMLAIVGTILGVLAYIDSINIIGIGDFFHALHELHISSELFLLIFLPILLFETSLAMNIRRLLDDLGPILMMAVVAVIICTLAVGFVLDYYSGYGLIVCLLLGSIVATTDPVAVIGIFKEVGAPKRLTTLVEGESLLNDAAAIALYSVFMMIVGSNTADISIKSLVNNFLYSFLVGGLTGFITGQITCYLFRYIRGWTAAEISLTVCCAYLTFFVAEHYLGVSGVVATVISGLVVGNVGRTRMTPNTFEHLSHAWGQFGFWANSLIFMFASLLIPQMMTSLTMKQVGLVVLLFVTTLAARAIVVFLLLPLLGKLGLGTKVNKAYRIVMWWGGMRGAISLALALAVVEQHNLPHDAQQLIEAATTCFVLSTLFINGLTLRPLIQKLGLHKLNPIEASVRNRAITLALDQSIDKTHEIANNLKLDDSAKKQTIETFEKALEAVREEQVEMDNDDQLALGLAMVSTHEEELYFDTLKRQIIEWPTAQILMANAELLGDSVRQGNARDYTKALRDDIKYSFSFRMAMRLQSSRLGISTPLAKQLTSRLIRLICKKSVVTRLIRFCETEVCSLIGEEASSRLIKIQTARLQTIETALNALELAYPSYVQATQANFMSRIARSIENESYAKMLSQALISNEIYSDLVSQIKARWSKLEKSPSLDVSLSPEELIKRVPLFQEVDEDNLKKISKLLKPRLMVPNQLIPTEFRGNKSMVFIASGAVVATLPDTTKVELGTGEMFGEVALLTDKNFDLNIRSMGYTKLLMLSARDLQTLMKNNAAIKERIDLVVKQRLRALEVWEMYAAKAADESNKDSGTTN